MESKVNYTIVGLFVVILTAAIIFSIIWLSSGISEILYKTYQVNMNESVNGLTLGSEVKFNGIDVGTVEEMNFNPKNPQQVILLLNVEQTTPITQSTYATLSLQGITGNSYIDLRTTGDDNRPLKRLPGEEYPIIKSRPSFFYQLQNSLGNLINNFNDMSVSIKKLLNDGNLQSVHDSLVNIKQFTGTIANDSKQIDAILHNADTATQKLPAMIQDGSDTFKSIKNDTLPKLNEILDNMKVVSHNLVPVSRDIKENPSVIIRGKKPLPLGPGER
jgi:phospholipid/cholesterol/gamma-HCH transport system substrate-binding protein